MTEPAERAPVSLTALAKRFVRYFGCFAGGVAIAVVSNLPFKELYPDDLKTSLVTISGLLLGVVAAVTQFALGEQPSRRLLRRLLPVALVMLLAGLVLFWITRNSRVVAVTVPAAKDPSHAFVIGAPGHRQPRCPCPANQTNEECLEERPLLSRVARCWPKEEIDSSKTRLVAGYVTMVVGFGSLISLLLLQEESARRARRQRRGSRSERRRPSTAE